MDNKKKINLLIALFLSVISVFIKLNMGLILFIIFIPTLFFLLYIKKITLKLFFSTILIFVLALWAGAYFLNVNLIKYLKSSTEIIDGYNDAMRIVVGVKALILPAMVFLITGIVIILKRNLIFNNKENIVKLLFILLNLFISFKYAYLRADGLHVFYFYLMILLQSALFIYFYNISVTYYYYLFLLVLVGAWGLRFKSAFVKHQYLIVPKIITEGLIESKIFPRTHSLPLKIRNKIGQKTVDVIPTDILLTYNNDLNYNPRPIFQSYSAYTPYLDSMNYLKYQSVTAPDFLIFQSGVIDDRCFFWDESKTKLGIWQRYKLVDSIFDDKKDISGLLFQKRDRALFISESVVYDTVIQNKDIINLKSTSNLLYLYADIQYSFLGKLKRFLFQPSQPCIELFYEDSTQFMHKIILPIAKGGILINKKIETTEEVYHAMGGQWNKNKNTIGFRINNQSLSFKDKIHIRIKEIIFK